VALGGHACQFVTFHANLVTHSTWQAGVDCVPDRGSLCNCKLNTWTESPQLNWLNTAPTQSQIGYRSFSVTGPWVSNNLPTEMLPSNIIVNYLRHFCSFRLRRIVTLLKCAEYKHSYSLTHSLTQSKVVTWHHATSHSIHAANDHHTSTVHVLYTPHV